MDNILVPNRKFQEQFRFQFQSIYRDFEPKLTEPTRNHLKELINEIESKNISFSNVLFGRRSIFEILERISQNVQEELLKEDIFKLRDLIRSHLSIEIETDSKGNSRVSGNDVELYIEKARYFCVLIDHSKHFQHLDKYKWNLAFIAELYAILITNSTIKSKICPLCFRDISSEESGRRSRKYCHLHKTNESDANSKNLLAAQAFKNLNKDYKDYIVLYTRLKAISGDHLQLIPNTQINRVQKALQSASYHGGIIGVGDSSTLIEDMKYIHSNQITVDIPNCLKDIESVLASIKPASSKLFVEQAYFKFISSFSTVSWREHQQTFIEEIHHQFPLTCATFKAPIPTTESFAELTALLYSEKYLDNQNNTCSHPFYLISALNISEDLLIEVEKIEHKKSLEELRKQTVLELHQQGVNDSEIKRRLDGMGNRTARKTIEKIINDFKAAKNVAPM